MENKKYELVINDSIMIGNSTLYRIRSLRNFDNIIAGILGGYVSGEHNLSHEGNCWVYGNAKVCGDAKVYENAKIYNNSDVYNAEVCGNAEVYDNAIVCGNAKVFSNAKVYGNADVCGNAKVYGDAIVHDNTIISNNADISSDRDYLYIKGIGSENRSTTVFKESDGDIHVDCGCFNGALNEFESKVKDSHGDNLYGKEYLAYIQVIKIHFGLI